MKALQVLVMLFAAGSLLVANKAMADPDDDSNPSKGGSPPVANEGGEVDRMKANQKALYDALYSFALPDVDPFTNVTQRFILQIPGKVLDPKEYYPGGDYVEYLDDPNKYSQEVHIPPIVMEKMFQLADAVPDANPLTGGETGLSLARIYETILGSMDVVNFAEFMELGRNIYNESLNELLKPLPDPDDADKTVPLLQLYSRFQDTYHEEQRKMEEIIRDKQSKLKAVEYQTWFQRDYDILNAKVEGAYTQWLLYGRKNLVESYIAHFDVTSAGQILEEARIRLRGSGFTAQDRSQRVYPVSFTPRNWFKYLKRREPPLLTRDQLEAKLWNVKSRITMLEAMKNASVDVTPNEKDELMKNFKKPDLKSKAEDLEKSRKACWLNVKKDGCDIQDKEQEVMQAIADTSAADLQTQLLENQFGAKSVMKGQIDVVMTALVDERDMLQNKLDNYDGPPSGATVVDAVGITQALDLNEMQDNWSVFEFSSAKSSTDSTSHGSQSKTSASVSSFFPWSPKVHVRASHGYTSFSQHVKDAKVKVRAKVLKVKINRPWFRPDLFKFPEFKMDQQRTNAHVSPGYLPEKTFYREIAGNPQKYLLYQYPTAFLLAKDVHMEFSGFDAKTKQKALTASVSASGRGGWGPFRFGGSTESSASYSHSQASATADGLSVQIPGAQIIGYYCDVVPKFPDPFVLSNVNV